MNFPEIVDIALPAEGVFHNLVFVSIKKTYPMQAYKIMHGLWGMGQMSKILAGVLLKDLEEVDQGNKVLRLRGCGFSNTEIAEMLNTTPLTVQVTASKLKAKKGRAKPSKSKSRK